VDDQSLPVDIIIELILGCLISIFAYMQHSIAFKPILKSDVYNAVNYTQFSSRPSFSTFDTRAQYIYQ
jgi:hypothetical protein